MSARAGSVARLFDRGGARRIRTAVEHELLAHDESGAAVSIGWIRAAGAHSPYAPPPPSRKATRMSTVVIACIAVMGLLVFGLGATSPDSARSAARAEGRRCPPTPPTGC